MAPYVLKDGNIILNMQDALSCVEVYNNELAEIINTEYNSALDNLEDCQQELKEAENELDQERDYIHTFQCDIRGEMDGIINHVITAKRLDRQALVKMLKVVWTMADNEL